MSLLATLSATFPALAAPFEQPFTSNVMNRLPVDVMDTGGTLIFSDSPEYVHRNGLLYTDTVNGDARILFYHLNDTGVKKKLAVIVENTSFEENRIEITRGGFSAPSEKLVPKSIPSFIIKPPPTLNFDFFLLQNQLAVSEARPQTLFNRRCLRIKILRVLDVVNFSVKACLRIA